MFKETYRVTNTGYRSNPIHGVKKLIMEVGVSSSGDVAASST